MTHGLQEPQGEVEAWVQMMDVGPWVSQKCAREIWRTALDGLMCRVWGCADEYKRAGTYRKVHGSCSLSYLSIVSWCSLCVVVGRRWWLS